MENENKVEKPKKDRKDFSNLILNRRKFDVVIICDSEKQQEKIFNKLIREGLKCKLST